MKACDVGVCVAAAVRGCGGWIEELGTALVERVFELFPTAAAAAAGAIGGVELAAVCGTGGDKEVALGNEKRKKISMVVRWIEG